MNTKNLAVTVRFPPSILQKIDETRGSEPLANFVRRVVVECLNDGQKNDVLLLEIRQAKLEILQTMNALAS